MIACSAIPKLLLVLKRVESKANIAIFSRNASKNIWSSMEAKVTIVNIMISQIKDMRELIKNSGDFLDNDSIKSFMNSLIKHLFGSFERESRIEEMKIEEKDDKEFLNFLSNSEGSEN